ncbi:hypothetical protein HY339_01705 [Candidatus Gottesmanbacteria bacterium]|nr:hypothetical protein [Candidatus Gottesmanbacteria bacterium]
MIKLITTIRYIVDRTTELKNKITNTSTAPVEFACVFCQGEEEYQEFTHAIETVGKIVEETPSGYTYLLNDSIPTQAGPLRLIEIRKPDNERTERGDADFNTDYKTFKKRYQRNPGFEFVKRETFEMLRLSRPNFDVMACFSNIPKSKILGIKLW